MYLTKQEQAEFAKEISCIYEKKHEYQIVRPIANSLHDMAYLHGQQNTQLMDNNRADKKIKT